MDFKEILGELYTDDIGTKLENSGKKFVDLNTGEYVSKKKYDDAISTSNDYKSKYETLLSNKPEKDAESIKQIETLTSENNSLKDKINDFQYAEEIRKSNVDEKYNGYLLFEAKKGMDDKTDFKTSLNNILEKNPQYKKQENVRRVSSSFSMSGNNVTTSSNSALNNSILEAVGRNK